MCHSLSHSQVNASFHSAVARCLVQSCLPTQLPLHASTVQSPQHNSQCSSFGTSSCSAVTVSPCMEAARAKAAADKLRSPSSRQTFLPVTHCFLSFLATIKGTSGGAHMQSKTLSGIPCQGVCLESTLSQDRVPSLYKSGSQLLWNQGSVYFRSVKSSKQSRDQVLLCLWDTGFEHFPAQEQG